MAHRLPVPYLANLKPITSRIQAESDKPILHADRSILFSFLQFLSSSGNSTRFLSLVLDYYSFYRAMCYASGSSLRGHKQSPTDGAPRSQPW